LELFGGVRSFSLSEQQQPEQQQQQQQHRLPACPPLSPAECAVRKGLTACAAAEQTALPSGCLKAVRQI